jgi:hypothetical protein
MTKALAPAFARVLYLFARPIIVGSTSVAAMITAFSPLPAAQTRAEVSSKEVASACRLEDGSIGRVSGISVEQMPAEPGDLPSLRVVIGQGEASARIFHDPDLAGVAQAGAACFGGLLALLQPRVPDHRSGFEWASIVLTRDRAYRAPSDGKVKRWVQRDFSGRWDRAAVTYLTVVVPHEQVHDSQNAQRGKITPRWFQEGHASWTGLKVTALIRPDFAALERRVHERQAASLKEPHLGSWGAMTIKKEAIDRQLSPEDRARREKDPTYMPKITFSFGPGDYAEDIENQVQRYGAALAIFDGLERRHGRDAVLMWIRAVMKDPANDRIAPLARELLGEDLTRLLR